MTEQEITIQLSDDPFDTKTVKVQVPHGTRLLSNESYAADVLSMYGVTDPTLQKTQLIEDNNAFTTRGEVSFISEDRERALIDIESKYTAFCTLTKEPDYIVDQLKVGMEIDVKIRTNKKNGDVIASISEAIKEVKLKEIKEAIENIFNVKVKKVNTLIVKGKLKAFRGTLGRRSNYKKAFITLEDGQTIDINAGI